MPTDRFHAAAVAFARIATRRTALKHSEMTERKVVFYRVVRIESRERARDFARRFPRHGLLAREAEIARKLVDVRVDRHEQHRGIDLPDSEIDAVLGTHHPTQIEEESFRTAAAAWIRQEMRGAASS